MKRFNLYGLLAAIILTLAACGGGGGGGGSATSPTTDKPLQSNTAIITISTEGTLAEGTSLGTAGITLELPPGVTVKHDAAAGAVEAGVIEPSGAAAGKAIVGISLYQPATEAAKGRVNFSVIASDRTGFGTGEFVTVICDIAAGSSPTATDFSIAAFEPFDVSQAAPIPTGPDGLQASFAVEFK